MDGSSSDKIAQVCGKMHLLNDQEDFAGNIEIVPQVMKKVYDNFKSIADVIEVAFSEIDSESISVDSIEKNTFMQRYLIGIVRCALRQCVSADGMINRRLVDLLTRIEAEYFVDVSKHLISGQPSDLSLLQESIDSKFIYFRFMVPEIRDNYLIVNRTCEAYNFTFGEDSVMEHLNKVVMEHKKDGCETCYHTNHIELCIVLKNFLQSIKDSICWEEICPWIEFSLDYMTFHSLYCLYDWERVSPKIMNDIDIHISLVIIYSLMWQSNTNASFTDDILVAYVGCLQAILICLLEEKIVEQAKHQFQIVQDALRLVHSLISNTTKHLFHEDELLLTKRNINMALRNLACIILQFVDDDFDEDKVTFEISPWLTETFQASLLPLQLQGFLSDETLTQYAYYFRHYQCELQENYGIGKKSAPENQSNFGEDLVCVARVVFYQWSEYLIDREILLNCRAEMVDMLRGLGIIICLSLKGEVDGNNYGLPDLVSKLERLKVQLTRTISLASLKRLCLKAPQTDLLGYLKFLLEDLEELRINNFDLERDWKDQFQTIQQDLVVFSLFLQNIRDNSMQNGSSEDLSLCLRNVAYSAGYIIDAFAAGAFHVCCRSFLLSDLIEQFSLIKEKANTKEIIIRGSSDVLTKEIVPKGSRRGAIRISRASVPPTDVVVGFEAEIKQMMERLASDKKELDVISIVGMAGIGKTTLATRVYEHPYTVNHFQLRSWCVVSQSYDVKDLLLSILGTGECHQESCEVLGVLLHKKLMGRKYLIVLDDLWDMNVFQYLKRFFPNDANGSRIVLTSRIISIGPDSNPLELHLLSDDESWDMLKQRVYPKEEFPVELFDIGKEVASKCGGLPLAVVVVAGLLAKSDKGQDVWKEVAERLCVYTADDSQGQGIKALDLSYELLPDHLKPLFLYFGAFREDEYIYADKLKWLWVAEGFIRKTKERSLEVQAETYLKDLIDRSLLMIEERKSDGSVKAFRIHDLMRDMALSKARAENFMQHLEQCENLPEHTIYQRRVSASISTSKNKREHESTPTPSTAEESFPRPPIIYEDLSRLSMSSCLNSLFLSTGSIASTTSSSGRKKLLEKIFQNHKMLRIFDMNSARLHTSSLTGLTFPAHLRYISVLEDLIDGIPSSVFTLRNLETLILNSHNTEVPREVWKLAKLRHLHIGSAIFCDPAEDSDRLENLQTLSMPFLCGEETKLIGRFPNLQKLKCIFSKRGRNNSGWPRLESLSKLESLQVQWYDQDPCKHLQLNLPATLKKLSLMDFCLKWNDISRFQEVLPNLEILKLNYGSVADELWNMGDVEFSKLKYLALRELNIKRWIASEDNFPRLRNLVISNCYHLEEIPSGLADICSLEKIEVLRCSHSASESAQRIQDEQVELGNDTPKVYISDPLPIADEFNDELDDESLDEDLTDKSSNEDAADHSSEFTYVAHGHFNVKGGVTLMPLWTGKLSRISYSMGSGE